MRLFKRRRSQKPTELPIGSVLFIRGKQAEVLYASDKGTFYRVVGIQSRVTALGEVGPLHVAADPSALRLGDRLVVQYWNPYGRKVITRTIEVTMETVFLETDPSKLTDLDPTTQKEYVVALSPPA